MLKNRTRYAILGVLDLSPSTGYDIKKYCDTVISGFWNENFGHIYPTLRALAEDGCIRALPSGETSRRIAYEITAQGKAELRAWLSEDTPVQPVRSEFMLKFLFSSQIPTAKVRDMLLRYRARMAAELASYEKLESALNDGVRAISKRRTRFFRATVRRGVLSARASVAWCDETLREIAGD